MWCAMKYTKNGFSKKHVTAHPFNECACPIGNFLRNKTFTSLLYWLLHVIKFTMNEFTYTLDHGKSNNMFSCLNFGQSSVAIG